MPTEAPPSVPKTGVAPTPAGEYKLSEHAPSSPRSNPALSAALAKHAGIPPQQATGEPRTIPGQPPRPTEPPAQTNAPKALETPPKPDDKPAPHVKFIPPDERETTPPAPEPPKVPGEPSPEVVKSAPAQLREAYEKLKSDFTARATEGDLTKKQLVEFQAKAKNYEDRIKTLESAEGRAKELEKQVLTYDEQLRVTNYLQHPEFHEKYVKPVAEAVQSAMALVKDLMVEQDDGTIRSGNETDFQEVLSQPNTTLAARKAKELFGDLAPQVVEARQRVKMAQEAQSKAVKDAGLESQKWLKQRQDNEAQTRTKAREALNKHVSTLAEKYPQLYRPPEGDNEAAAARKSGEDLAALVIQGTDEPIDQDQWFSAVAKVYHRAASFPMRELMITRLQSELDATKAKLAAYEKSSPDVASRQHAAGTADAGGTIVTRADDLSAKMHESLARRAGSRR